MSIQAAGFHSAMQSGCEALQNNDLTAAIEAYTLALKFTQGPASDAEAFTYRAAAYYRKGEFDRAIADCSAAIKRKPDYPHAYLNRGMTYVKTGKIKRALRDYAKAIHYKPDYALFYIYRGMAYEQVHEVEHAVADYDRAIELDPQNQGARALRDEAHKELVNQPNN